MYSLYQRISTREKQHFWGRIWSYSSTKIQMSCWELYQVEVVSLSMLNRKVRYVWETKLRNNCRYWPIWWNMEVLSWYLIQKKNCHWPIQEKSWVCGNSFWGKIRIKKGRCQNYRKLKLSWLRRWKINLTRFNNWWNFIKLSKLILPLRHPTMTLLNSLSRPMDFIGSNWYNFMKF